VSAPVLPTYVLVGADFRRIVSPEAEKAATRRGVHFLHVDNYPDIRDAIAQIRTPANIIGAFHGNKNGKFKWGNRWGRISYKDFFAELPRTGIQSITLESCYGGEANASRFLIYAPKGTVIQSVVGPDNIGLASTLMNFTNRLDGLSQQAGLLVSALAAFNPWRYEHETTKIDLRKHKHFNTNPLQALPHIIGVGGGQRIDLSDELGRLTGILSDPKTKAAWDQAVAKVKKEFGAAANGKIDEIIRKIEKNGKVGQDGSNVQKANELRVGYALTAAYLDASGELESRFGAHTAGPQVAGVTPVTTPLERTAASPSIPATQPPRLAQNQDAQLLQQNAGRRPSRRLHFEAHHHSGHPLHHHYRYRFVHYLHHYLHHHLRHRFGHHPGHHPHHHHLKHELGERILDHYGLAAGQQKKEPKRPCIALLPSYKNCSAIR